MGRSSGLCAARRSRVDERPRRLSITAAAAAAGVDGPPTAQTSPAAPFVHAAARRSCCDGYRAINRVDRPSPAIHTSCIWTQATGTHAVLTTHRRWATADVRLRRRRLEDRRGSDSRTGGGSIRDDQMRRPRRQGGLLEDDSGIEGTAIVTLDVRIAANGAGAGCNGRHMRTPGINYRRG